MIRYGEVQDALVQRDMAAIEAAFRAFLALAQEDSPAGFGTPGEMLSLFEQVCQALQADETALPADTAELLFALAQRFDAVFSGPSYAAGAELAFTHLAYFGEAFRRHLGRETDAAGEPSLG